jgi:hypothetical protein
MCMLQLGTENKRWCVLGVGAEGAPEVDVWKGHSGAHLSVVSRD